MDAFIAGGDEQVLQTVSELVETVGFNPVIAGDLLVSGTLGRKPANLKAFIRSL